MNIPAETGFDVRRKILLVKNPLDKELVIVQIYGSAADFPTDHVKSAGAAKLEIDFLFRVLMESDADIRRSGTDQYESVGSLRPHGIGNRVINGLGPNRRDIAQIQQPDLSHAFSLRDGYFHWSRISAALRMSAGMETWTAGFNSRPLDRSTGWIPRR